MLLRRRVGDWGDCAVGVRALGVRGRDWRGGVLDVGAKGSSRSWESVMLTSMLCREATGKDSLRIGELCFRGDDFLGDFGMIRVAVLDVRSFCTLFEKCPFDGGS